MTVLISAMNTSRWNPASKAAINMKNLEKNPANGGIPAKENRDIVIRKAIFGFVLYNPW